MNKPKKLQEVREQARGVGRPTKFKNANEMRKEIEKYFNSIRTVKPLWTTAEDSGRYTAEELETMPIAERAKRIPLTDLNGDAIYEVTWAVPPSEGDLHRFLGMTRETWSQYAQKDEFSDTIREAKQIVEDYYRRQLAERLGNTSGLQFVMRCCYGWKDVTYSKVETNGKLEDLMTK